MHPLNAAIQKAVAQFTDNHQSLSLLMSNTLCSIIEIQVGPLLAEKTKALRDIASGSPAVQEPGTPQARSCALCLAHIDHARDALGFEHWPAVPGTVKATPDNALYLAINPPVIVAPDDAMPDCPLCFGMRGGERDRVAGGEHYTEWEDCPQCKGTGMKATP